MHRRQLLTSTACTGLALALARPLQALPLAGKRNGIGVQLWTVRNQLANDSKATLKAIAQAGYDQVELMNVLDSREIVKQAKDLGLNVRSAFFNWESVCVPDKAGVPKIDSIIDAAAEMKLEYLVFGYIGKSARDTEDKLKRIIDNANSAGEKIKNAGMKMSYHNHSFEFMPLPSEKTGFELFIDGFDKQLVQFEFDVFWAAIGGWDPVATMKKLSGRINQVHLKDIKRGIATNYDEGTVPKDAFQEVGDGVLNMKEIVELASEQGVEQFHVEQDESPDPISSIGQSISYVRKIW